MRGGGGTASTEVLKQRCDRAVGQILCSCFTPISVTQTSLPFLPPYLCSGCFVLGIPSSFNKSLNTFNAPGPGNSKTNQELIKSCHTCP